MNTLGNWQSQSTPYPYGDKALFQQMVNAYNRNSRPRLKRGDYHCFGLGLTLDGWYCEQEFGETPELAYAAWWRKCRAKKYDHPPMPTWSQLLGRRLSRLSRSRTEP